MQTVNLYSLLDKKFVGTDDLRKNLTEILENLPKGGGQLIITQHGQPKGVLLNLETYLDLYETIEDLQRPGFIESIHQAAKDVRAGKGISHEQLLKELGI